MKRVVVIGLGIFGSQLARQLYDNGIEVVAIDKNRDVVQRIKDHSTKAVLADATDKEVLESSASMQGIPSSSPSGGPVRQHPADPAPEGIEGQDDHRQGAQRGPTNGSCSRWEPARPSSPSARWPTGWREALFPERAGVSADFR